MAFSGWPEEALDFYDGLAADNSKTFWTAHKHIYDEQVRAPLLELAAELEREFGPAKLTFTNYPARDPDWDPNTWWLHEPARSLTVIELAKLSVEVANSAFH